MQKIIVYKTESGGVAICKPAALQDFDQVLKNDCPFGAVVINESSIPQDVDFFDAFELDGQQVTVNMKRAQEITKQRLRQERAPLLAALDVRFQRALEDGSDTKPIVSEKCRLRSVTDLVSDNMTLAELRGLSVNP